MSQEDTHAQSVGEAAVELGWIYMQASRIMASARHGCITTTGDVRDVFGEIHSMASDIMVNIDLKVFLRLTAEQENSDSSAVEGTGDPK